MPAFKCIQDPLTMKEFGNLNLPQGATPNDFKKILMGNNNFPFPTICSIDKKGFNRIYLSRSEWDFVIQNDEVCSFMFHPQADGGVGEALVVSLIISIVIGVGTYLLTPRPNLNLNQVDKGSSPTYDLTSQGNKPRPNLPIPIHYGTIRCYPDVAVLPFTRAVYPLFNYYKVGLCVGQDEIQVSDIQIDDTPLSKFAWVRTWYSSGSPIPINGFERPMITSKEVKNIEIIQLNNPVNFTFSLQRASDININIASPGTIIDGLTMSLGKNVLLFKQTDTSQNGVWTWNGATESMTRNASMNESFEFINRAANITGGTYTGQDFVQVNQVDAVGKDPVEFEYYDTVNGVGDYYVLNDANPISKVKKVFLDFSCFQGIFLTGAGVNNFGNVIVGSTINENIAVCPSTINGRAVLDIISVGSLVLLMGQTNSSENGVYSVAAGVGNPMVRATGMDAPNEFLSARVNVNLNSNAGEYFQTAIITTVGVDPVTFAKSDPNSVFNPYSIGLVIYIQIIDSLGVNIGSPIANKVYISGSSNQPIYQTFEYELVDPERVKVKVLRLSPAKYKTDNKYSDLVQWSGLRGEFNDIPIYNNKTFIVIEAKATGKLNDSNIGIFNCLGKRVLFVYDFALFTWSKQQSNEPIWAFWDLGTSARGTCDYALDLDEGLSLDLANIEDIYNKTLGEGYECNTRFDTAISGEEAMAQIAQSMKCVVYKRGGKYLLAHDGIPTTLQGFFTRTNSDNVSIDFFTKNEFSATWFKITYYDEVTSKKETVDCIIPGESTETGPVEEIELKTITARLQAWRYGMYLCAQSRYHNTKVRFQSDLEGFLPNPMDHISFCHPLLTPENQHGYVQKVSGTTIYLSEPVAFLGFSSGFISFKNKNGSTSGPYVCSQLENPYKVEIIPLAVNALNYTLFTFFSQESQPDFEPTEYTFGVTKSSEILVIKSVSASGSNSSSIEAVIRDKRVYTADFQYHLMPDYNQDTTLQQWYPMVMTPTECKVVVATKTVTTKWIGCGHKEYKVRYLYNNGGVEVMQTFTVVQIGTTPVEHVHSYVYTYNTIPVRVTITPTIHQTLSPDVSFEVPFLAEAVGIQLL